MLTQFTDIYMRKFGEMGYFITSHVSTFYTPAFDTQIFDLHFLLNESTINNIQYNDTGSKPLLSIMSFTRTTHTHMCVCVVCVCVCVAKPKYGNADLQPRFKRHTRGHLCNCCLRWIREENEDMPSPSDVRQSPCRQFVRCLEPCKGTVNRLWKTVEISTGQVKPWYIAKRPAFSLVEVPPHHYIQIGRLHIRQHRPMGLLTDT